MKQAYTISVIIENNRDTLPTLSEIQSAILHGRMNFHFVPAVYPSFALIGEIPLRLSPVNVTESKSKMARGPRNSPWNK